MWHRVLKSRRLWQDSLSPFLKKELSSSSRHNVRRRSMPHSSSILANEGDDHQKDPSTGVADPIDYSKESPKQLLDNAKVETDMGAIDPDDVWSDERHYPTKSNKKQSQAKFSNRPNIDPAETSVIFFPGQGTQYVGMGKDLLEYPNVKEMYDCASHILGYDLLALCLDGPKDKLSKTVHQQPAILVSSLAAVEKLREERPHVLESCVGVAGFSVGEITALTFAGCFSFEDAVSLVKVRAEAMQYASELTPSGMMTVLYGPDSRLGFACTVAKEYCERKGLEDVDCKIASYLFPHCKVIAGNDEALSFIEDNKDDFRLRRLKRLPVSGAFHTHLMKPAAEPFKKALNNIHIDKPLIPVHSNIDGKIYKTVSQISKQLPKQMYFPVKWEQTMHILFERHRGVGFPKTYECGPKQSLKTILKMCNAQAFNFCSNIEA